MSTTSPVFPDLLSTHDVSTRLFFRDHDLDVESSLLEYLRVLLSDPSCIVSGSNEQHNDEKALFRLDGTDAALVNFRYVQWSDSGRTRDGESETARSWDDVERETGKWMFLWRGDCAVLLWGLARANYCAFKLRDLNCSLFKTYNQN